MPNWGFSLGSSSSSTSALPKPTLSETLSGRDGAYPGGETGSGSVTPRTALPTDQPAQTGSLLPIPGQQQATTTAIVNEHGNYGDPSHPPNNAPGTRWFYSGTEHQWVDSSGQYDANGNVLNDAERQKWALYDKNRASQTAAQGGGGGVPASTGVGGSTNWRFNHADQKFEIYNPKGGTDGKGGWEAYTAEELAANPSQEVRKIGPGWMWAQELAKQNEGYLNDTYNAAADQQRRGGMSNTRYRFIPNYI